MPPGGFFLFGNSASSARFFLKLQFRPRLEETAVRIGATRFPKVSGRGISVFPKGIYTERTWSQ